MTATVPAPSSLLTVNRWYTLRSPYMVKDVAGWRAGREAVRVPVEGISIFLLCCGAAALSPEMSPKGLLLHLYWLLIWSAIAALVMLL